MNTKDTKMYCILIYISLTAIMWYLLDQCSGNFSFPDIQILKIRQVEEEKEEEDEDEDEEDKVEEDKNHNMYQTKWIQVVKSGSSFPGDN